MSATADWHEDFPEDAREVWDMVAKALLLRTGDKLVTVTKAELAQAGRTQALITLEPNGTLHFFIQDQQPKQN